jgi:hypothetical protein
MYTALLARYHRPREVSANGKHIEAEARPFAEKGGRP